MSETVLGVVREEGDRQVEDAHRREREGDRAEGGDILELTRDDERRDRVADRDEQHLADRDQARRSAGRETGTHHDDADPDEADHEADHAHGLQNRAIAAGEGDHRGEQRHGRHEQSGQPRRERLLGVPEQQERPGHLDRAEREHPADLAERGSQRFLPQREGKQEERTQQSAAGDDGCRRVGVDGLLDEEVRHAPEHGHRGEEDPGASIEPLERGGHRAAQTARRPSKARPSVTSSAYSRSPPTGSPEARRVTAISRVCSRRLR